jgi:predicted nucleotidyltransferase
MLASPSRSAPTRKNPVNFSRMTPFAPSRAEVEACLISIRRDILGLGVHRLALFGSVARDQAHPGSDVDLLVEFEPGLKSFDRFMELGDLLERALGRDVELVTPESLSPFLKPHILAEAEDVVRAA